MLYRKYMQLKAFLNVFNKFITLILVLVKEWMNMYISTNLIIKNTFSFVYILYLNKVGTKVKIDNIMQNA